MAKRTTGKHHHDESSESENENEPAKIFHRRLSTNGKSAVSNATTGTIWYFDNFISLESIHVLYRLEVVQFYVRRLCLVGKLIKFQFDPDR